MKCPVCENKIGFFSKALNKWGKYKTCLYCQTSSHPVFLSLHIQNHSVSLQQNYSDFSISIECFNPVV